MPDLVDGYRWREAVAALVALGDYRVASRHPMQEDSKINGLRARISWEAMLDGDERDAAEEEIAALEAEHGPFLPADGEG